MGGINESRDGLHRSNSSLELENIDYIDSDSSHGGFPMHRDYGSTSSLDMIANNNNSEQFFKLIQGYCSDRGDQRAPAPPQMQDLLKPRSPPESRVGALAHSTSANLSRLTQRLADLPAGAAAANGSLPSTASHDPQTDYTTSSQGSPKLKSKSQKNKADCKNRYKSMVLESSGGSNGGLLKKLRGKSESAADSADNLTAAAVAGDIGDPFSQEERLRRKAFLHYDTQSIAVSMLEVRERRRNANEAVRGNVSTGASAASSVNKLYGSGGGIAAGGGDNTPRLDADPGDGKSSELVQACPYFRNELGREEERCVALSRSTAMKRTLHLLGAVTSGSSLVTGNRSEASGSDASEAGAGLLRRHPVCSGIAVLDFSQNAKGKSLPTIQSLHGLVVEYVDHGALYYRHFFEEYEHQNFFGIDEDLGPVAISLRRERLQDYPPRALPAAATRVETGSRGETGGGGAGGSGVGGGVGPLWQYRIIVRTSELTTLRGTIPEDLIPSSSSRLHPSRGLPPKDVLDFVVPEISPSCLRLAQSGEKTQAQLKKLDEQGLTKHYKVGIMYCKPDQTTEEEAYNNEHASPAFDEFLDCLGQRVRLQHFNGYRGGLDCKTNSTGTHSLHTTIMDYEIMFHVSTLLPFTPTQSQQLLRKSHIGNDIVTLVFQEPGSRPFTPRSILSHFQHVFIIIRAHNPCTENTTYSVAVSRSKEVPAFGPPVPDGAVFNRGPKFAEFLKMKMINAENAVHRSFKFAAMATRTREQYLQDLAEHHVSATTLEQASKTSKFSLGGRKKEKGRQLSVPDAHLQGAISWVVMLEHFGENRQLRCYLGMAVNTIVLVEVDTQEVVFVVPCKAVLGWSSGVDSLQLYYDHGELVSLHTLSDYTEIREITARLKATTRGTETKEMTLQRNKQGQLGFHVHYEGIVSEVEKFSFAWQAGLRDNDRLVEVCKIATATLTHDQLVDLLRTSATVNVVVVPAHEDGTERRAVDELRSSHTAYLAQFTVPCAPDPAANRSAAGGSSNYSDLRALQPPRDLRQAALVNHAHTSSHDSAGSRSSGHGSEGPSALDMPPQPNLSTRTYDTMSSEGFVSGGDSDRDTTRGHVRNIANGDWSGQVRYLPAYNKDNKQLPGSGPLSPGLVESSTWFPSLSEHTTTSGGVGSSQSSSQHHQQQQQQGRGASLKGGGKNLSFRGNLVPRPYKPTQSSDGREPGSSSFTAGSGPTSALDARRQPSSNSLRHHPLPPGREELATDPSRRGLGSGGGGSSAGSSPSSTLQQQRARLTEGSPRAGHSKGRPLAQGASTENLSGGRPGSGGLGPSVRPRSNTGSSQSAPVRKDSRGTTLTSTATGTTSGGHAAQSSFEMELKRLINPDWSYTEEDREDQYSTTSSGGGRARYPYSSTHAQLSPSAARGRLVRAHSDESMCGGGGTGSGALSPRLHHRTLVGGATGESSDVILTTAVPVHLVAQGGRRGYSREQRSPSSHNLSTSATSPSLGHTLHSRSNPQLTPVELPAGEQLDWGHLVFTATRALQLDETPADFNPSRSRASKSSPARFGGKDAATSSGAQHNSARQKPLSAAQLQRIEELELRVAQLQSQLDLERAEKGELAGWVEQLEVDNARLARESQQAAGQLRKFTEWFFQTIDRQ